METWVVVEMVETIKTTTKNPHTNSCMAFLTCTLLIKDPGDLEFVGNVKRSDLSLPTYLWEKGEGGRVFLNE